MSSQPELDLDAQPIFELEEGAEWPNPFGGVIVLDRRRVACKTADVDRLRVRFASDGTVACAYMVKPRASASVNRLCGAAGAVLASALLGMVKP